MTCMNTLLFPQCDDYQNAHAHTHKNTHTDLVYGRGKGSSLRCPTRAVFRLGQCSDWGKVQTGADPDQDNDQSRGVFRKGSVLQVQVALRYKSV